ncbi:ErfK/YbiS/YcfS/YnhG [[Clostridium] hylemonae DSM 15053]|uniref:ErfK/YbiS/YcfS/YnhG n=1 Tax=[Clostridium] hylemonae DSM 15053 TaxID=553973 RepID=C0C2C0_9FIRM|nr:ErfK/YbiS/YcfS/YnhG [[Clostridium] hylemonae DSM 15053]
MAGILVFATVVNVSFVSSAYGEEEVQSDTQNTYEADSTEINIWTGSVLNGDRAYWNSNGEKVVGQNKIGDKIYYFSEEGFVQTGWIDIGGENYYFSLENGERYEERTETIDGVEYFFDLDGRAEKVEKSSGPSNEELDANDIEKNNGIDSENKDVKEDAEDLIQSKDASVNQGAVNSVTILKGWQDTPEGKKYYDGEGNFVVGIQNIDNKLYSFDEKGVLQTGWIESDGKKTYYGMPDGSLRTGWLHFGEIYYYCGSNGEIMRGYQKIGSSLYYFNEEGIRQTGWIESDGKKTYYGMPDGSLRTGWLHFGEIYYYCGSNGEIMRGYQKIGSSLYYFNEEGIRQTGWIESDGKRTYYGMPDGSLRTGWLRFGNIYYYCGSDGVIVTGVPKTVNGVCYYFNDEGIRSKAPGGWQIYNGKTYYGMPDGTFRIGWLKFGNIYYYLDKDGVKLTGLNKIGGDLYFFNDEGVRQTGWIVAGGTTYYGMPDGSLRTGWLKFGNTYYYCDNDGAVIIGTPRIVNGVCYYFNDEGIRSKAPGGWQIYNGKTYYGMPDGTFRTGWLKFGNIYYYFDNNGVKVTGLNRIEGNLYYFNDEGIRQTGWIKVAGNKSYYGMPDGVLRIGWLKFGDIYYYCNSNAEIVVGDYVVSGVLYTFDSNGIMQKKSGWGSYNGLKYYFNPSTGFPYKSQWVTFGATHYYANCNGFMVQGWQNINGKYYYFYPATNIMARNTTIDGFVIGADGVRVPTILSKMTARAWGYSSLTGYLLMVDRDAHKVGVFKGKQGEWNNLYFWDCGNGASSTPTVAGVFKVGMKGYYFDSGSARCFWYTQFYGNYLFHSVLCYKDGRIMDGRVGMALSHGCVRLQIPNAKWIYDNIPKGTTVVVY